MKAVVHYGPWSGLSSQTELCLLVTAVYLAASPRNSLKFLARPLPQWTPAVEFQYWCCESPLWNRRPARIQGSVAPVGGWTCTWDRGTHTGPRCPGRPGSLCGPCRSRSTCVRSSAAWSRHHRKCSSGSAAAPGPGRRCSSAPDCRDHPPGSRCACWQTCRGSSVDSHGHV